MTDNYDKYNKKTKLDMLWIILFNVAKKIKTKISPNPRAKTQLLTHTLWDVGVIHSPKTKTKLKHRSKWKPCDIFQGIFNMPIINVTYLQAWVDPYSQASAFKKKCKKKKYCSFQCMLSTVELLFFS